MIPSASNYPAAFDTDDNLCLVHDSLAVKLAEDYTPGDTSITVTGNADVIARFPQKGFITLTEQCNEPELRALTFYYGSHTETTFDELEILPGFTDVVKPKMLTDVTQNVMDHHHNIIKDACIAIEEFIGVKGTVDTAPFGPTLVGRLNFLRRLVLSPRAWFSFDKRIGIVPVTVVFVDESFRDPTSAVWDFGDGTSIVSGVSVISGISSISTDISYTPSATPGLTPIVSGAVPCGEIVPLTREQRTVSHTYFTPGKYDITLTVGNKFGRDSVTFPEAFVARAIAPDEAEILISPEKARANQVINIEVITNGEQTDGGNNVIDEIVEYTWKIGDDLPHASAPEAIALFSIGGIYDVKLRVDTELGAYRITTVEDAINVVEQTNLWLMAFDSAKSNNANTKNVRTYEFGLTSETWKSEVMPELTVTRDADFMDGYPNEDYQRALFRRNNAFVQKGTLASGDRGLGVVCWAEQSNKIRYAQCALFDETWSTSVFNFGNLQTRNWNWMAFGDQTNLYVLFGVSSVEESPGAILSSRIKNNMSTGATGTGSYATANYINGADELTTLADDAPATYRVVRKDSNAFFARNDAGPGGFFRIRSFYRTEGVLSDIAQDIRKLPDIPGTARTELQLVSLASGVFVFNNSGEVSAYNPTTNVWTSGGPGVGSAAFRSLQDSAVEGFAAVNQPFLATSDNDRRAYLSFDYSSNAFVKFNESDLTFTQLPSRPTSNEQFVMTVF